MRRPMPVKPEKCEKCNKVLAKCKCRKDYQDPRVVKTYGKRCE